MRRILRLWIYILVVCLCACCGEKRDKQGLDAGPCWQAELGSKVKGVKLRLIPGGSFTMGSRESEHDERISKEFSRLERPRVVQVHTFYIQVTGVTNGQFHEFLKETGYQSDDRRDLLRHEVDERYAGFRGADQPVVFVSLDDAEAFCRVD